MTDSSKFDAAAESWVSILDEPWNRLRYTLYRANLARHLPESPADILDAGGGPGRDAVPLARDGHRVTLCDYSGEMLAQAEAHAKTNGVSLTLHHAPLNDLSTLFPQPAFDVVLLHNVIPYVDDLAAALRAAVAPLRPGGMISVVAVNRFSEPLQSALLRLDPDEALTRLDEREMHNPVFDTLLRRFAAEEVIPPLEAAGTTLLGHYGVRCVMDYMADNDLKRQPDFYARLERLELALADRYPYYLLGRFFQLIARKN